MIKNTLYGAWTYRSFFNRTEPVAGLNDVLLAEAVMVFEASLDGEIHGELVFPSDPPRARDARLTLTGSFVPGATPSARFQGVGVPKTDAEGWVYDYVGFLVPKWPNGQGQTTALVGSVVRTVAHAGHGGIRKAGEVYSFVAVRREFLEPRHVGDVALPPNILDMQASRHHRLHHAVWHGVRNGWLGLSPRRQRAITALGWEPPRPARHSDGAPCIDNGSGEDFLFMHRQMINEVNSALRRQRKQPIKGWDTVPAPGSLIDDDNPGSPIGNPDGFAVPPTWISSDEQQDRRLAALKSDQFYWTRMLWWDRKFKDPQYLRTLTLGELGSLIEFSVHNDMHMRWSSVPRDPQDGKPVPDGRDSSDISKRWDTPTYDHLGDFYSSHVNPVFWRLHGWVDDRINDWFEAHQQAHPGAVVQKTVTINNVKFTWFERGQWVVAPDPWCGPSMIHRDAGMRSKGMKGMSGMKGGDIQTMEKVVAILYAQPGPREQRAVSIYGPHF
jgi:hypothetical protein